MQPKFWDTLAEHVTAKVEPVLRQKPSVRQPVIAYLRNLETVARRECHSREVIQVIVSGRQVLGDQEEVEPQDGPFART